MSQWPLAVKLPTLLFCPGKCLFLSGLTDEQLNYMHDQSLPENYSIGFTNMVERTTPGSKDLSRWIIKTHLSIFRIQNDSEIVLQQTETEDTKMTVRHSHLETNSDDILPFFCLRPSKEIREGGRQLLEKLQKYKPLIAAFNGKGKMIEHFFSVP